MVRRIYKRLRWKKRKRRLLEQLEKSYKALNLAYLGAKTVPETVLVAQKRLHLAKRIFRVEKIGDKN